jgi:hypothetical protein
LKRLSVAAIRGSLIMFYNLKPRRGEDEVPTAIDENDDAENDPDEHLLQDDLHAKFFKK